VEGISSFHPITIDKVNYYMQAVKTDRTMASKKTTNKLIISAIILVILVVSALYFYNAQQKLQPASLPEDTVTISQTTLEKEYGLRVNLVAVTGAGGFVDVRLKILDGEKAKSLLSDKTNFPTLLVNDDIILNASEDTKSQEIRFNDDSNIFIMYVNSVNVVKQGSQLRIRFGDIVLDPITVK